jgi:aldose 1-epimerase
MTATTARGAPSGQQHEIAFGDRRAVVVEVGGGLRSLSAGGRELLDGYGADEMCTSGRGQVLIPWPNRIEDGSYEWDGQRHQLALTEVENGNAIHGLVRWAPWTVREHEQDRVVLGYLLHPQPGYPFALALELEYALSEHGLAVRTTATNVGSQACPYGAGFHPYLTLGTSTVDAVLLRVPGESVAAGGVRGLPGAVTAVAGTELDFRTPRPIGATQLDHAFGDLERDADGVARVELRDPAGGAGIAVWADERHSFFQLFTGDPLPDVARRSIAVEPMTCAPNAFRTGEGLARLEPGDSCTSVWGVELRV